MLRVAKRFRAFSCPTVKPFLDNPLVAGFSYNVRFSPKADFPARLGSTSYFSLTTSGMLSRVHWCDHRARGLSKNGLTVGHENALKRLAKVCMGKQRAGFAGFAAYNQVSKCEFGFVKIKTLAMNGCSPGVFGVLVTLVVALQACVSIPPRNAVPEDMVELAVIPGGSQARMWGDTTPADVDARIELLRQQFAASGDEDVYTRDRNYLAISGGGANGAFGAGLLKGCTESGTRPELWVVTGISTGALIAPFAFLGSDYDDELEGLYTTLSTSDLLKKRSLIKGLTSDALADTRGEHPFIASVLIFINPNSHFDT